MASLNHARTKSGPEKSHWALSRQTSARITKLELTGIVFLKPETENSKISYYASQATNIHLLGVRAKKRGTVRAMYSGRGWSGPGCSALGITYDQKRKENNTKFKYNNLLMSILRSGFF